MEDTFTWLRTRLSDLLAQDQERGDLARTVAPEHVASMICAVVQGGYVLARAHQSTEPFQEAVTGAAAMLAMLASPTAAGTQGREEPA